MCALCLSSSLSLSISLSLSLSHPLFPLPPIDLSLSLCRFLHLYLSRSLSLSVLLSTLSPHGRVSPSNGLFLSPSSSLSLSLSLSPPPLSLSLSLSLSSFSHSSLSLLSLSLGLSPLSKFYCQCGRRCTKPSASWFCRHCRPRGGCSGTSPWVVQFAGDVRGKCWRHSKGHGAVQGPRLCLLGWPEYARGNY